MKSLILFLALVVVSCTSSTQSSDQKLSNDLERVKSLRKTLDDNSYKAFTLDNKLRVMLISDPNAKQCAASMNVAVGSLANPPEHQGLAHYLEHVLFMGTKKYPKVGGYWEYMSNNQGSANAYTASEDTNYMFQVNIEAFDEGLDRFAQFFISPTFDAKYLQKEKNAVHSEFDKNHKNDGWRSYQLYKTMARKGHPVQSFSIGNLKTLEKTSQKDVIDFYNQYYSANNMTLALYCKKDMASLETLARSLFKDVPNKNLTTPTYPEDILDKSALPKMVKAKPIKDESNLEFVFTMPPALPYWKTKPLNAISYLINREGKGSFLSILKERQLATEVSSGAQDYTFASTFFVSIKLTDLGKTKVDEIQNLFFSYINMIKENGFKPYVYDLMSTMANNDYIYREARSPMNTAVYYAKNMRFHPAVQIDENLMLMHEYSAEDFNKFLSYIEPKSTLVFLYDKDVKTDKIEPYFDIEYSETKIDEKTATMWTQIKPQKEYSYPAKNNYIPSDLALVKGEGTMTPEKLFSSDQGEFWFHQDTSFKRPKGFITLKVLSEKANNNPKDVAQAVLMTSLINEYTNEWRDELSDAGLSLSVGHINEGVQVSLSGYSHHVPRVLDEYFARLSKLNFEQNRFTTVKRELMQDLENKGFQNAYISAIEAMDAFTTLNEVHSDDYKPFVKTITLKELNQFKTEYFSKVAFYGMAYGNLTAAPIKSTFSSITKSLNTKFIPKDKHPHKTYVKLPTGKPIAYIKQVKNNNNAWTSKVLFGKRSPRNEALVRLLNGFWKGAYFTDLRDKKQLGYIVHAGASQGGSADISSFAFILQSKKYKANELAKHSQTWTLSQIKALKKLDKAKFESVRQAVIANLSKPEVNMSERFSRIWEEAYSLKGDFEYRRKLLNELETMKQVDFTKEVELAFAPNRIQQISAYVVADNEKLPTKISKSTIVRDLTSEKKKLAVY